MADYYYPSFQGGPNYGYPNFVASNWEHISNMSVNPISVVSTGGLSKLDMYRGRPYNTNIQYNSRFTITPHVGGVSTSTGILFCRLHPSWGYPSYDDYITCQVILTTYAPGQCFEYRVYIASQRGGVHYDTGIPYIVTTKKVLNIETQLFFLGDEGGYVDLAWSVNIAEIPLAISGWIYNYGYPNYLNDRPDDWWGVYFGGHHGYFTTEIFKVRYLTVSRINSPSGIISSEVFGSPTLTLGIPAMLPSSILSSEAWGLPTIGTIAIQQVSPYGIVSSESWGEPCLAKTSTPISALPPPVETEIGDIRLELNEYNQYLEIIPSDRDVERDAGFETAVLLTLGTDKRADEEDPLPDESGYKGGWWGDSIPPAPEYKMGTKLWLLQRAKTEKEIPGIAKEYLLDGFKWMIEDGIVEKINVEVERRRDLKTTLAFTLSFIKPEGETIFYKFFYNWEKQLLRRR